MAKKTVEPVDVEQQVKSGLAAIKSMEAELLTAEAELMTSPAFKAFNDLQKKVNTTAAEFWKMIEQRMLDTDTKSIKGDFGSVTIVERNNYKVIDLDKLPKKFVKKVADTTLIGDTYELTSKLPEGVEISVTKYLTKRLK